MEAGVKSNLAIQRFDVKVSEVSVMPSQPGSIPYTRVVLTDRYSGAEFNMSVEHAPRVHDVFTILVMPGEVTLDVNSDVLGKDG